MRLARFVPAGWLVATVIVGWGAIEAYQPPAAVPASAPDGVFSAARAWRHVEAIAKQPHPRGSPENAAVAEYLLGELRALGLEVQVQDAEVARKPDRPPVPVRNLIARRAGSANTRALMLVTHYDSVALAPGAADDGAAVAAMLETVRALAAHPPLRNDLILLITDGEEEGMLGARAFAAEHPWMRDVGMVCNFEARGSRGPVLMFETGPNNGHLIAEFARAARPVFSTSLAEVVYRSMPNNGDFTVFRDAGLGGLNFAFIDGVENYHRPSDNLANLDPRSLQHHGALALGVARHFGNRELPVPPATSTVHFNLFGPVFVHYPQTWALWAAVFLAVLAFGALWPCARRRGLAAAGVAGAFAAYVGAMVVMVPLALWAAPFVAEQTHERDLGFAMAAVMGFAVLAGVHLAIRRRVHRLEAATALLLLWLAGAGATAVWLVEGSYLLLWPALVGWGTLVVTAVATGQSNRSVAMLAAGGALLPAALLHAPLLHQVAIAFRGPQPFLVLPAAWVAMLALPVLDGWLPGPWTREGRAPEPTPAPAANGGALPAG